MIWWFESGENRDDEKQGFDLMIKSVVFCSTAVNPGYKFCLCWTAVLQDWQCADMQQCVRGSQQIQGVSCSFLQDFSESQAAQSKSVSSRRVFSSAIHGLSRTRILLGSGPTNIAALLELHLHRTRLENITLLIFLDADTVYRTRVYSLLVLIHDILLQCVSAVWLTSIGTTLKETSNKNNKVKGDILTRLESSLNKYLRKSYFKKW